jgi:hypothetical protein
MAIGWIALGLSVTINELVLHGLLHHRIDMPGRRGSATRGRRHITPPSANENRGRRAGRPRFTDAAHGAIGGSTVGLLRDRGGESGYGMGVAHEGG